MKLDVNQAKLKLKAEEIKIFSDEENGVIMDPILIVILIPKRYGAGLIFKIRVALITKGTNMIATVTSAMIAAEIVPIVQIK